MIRHLFITTLLSLATFATLPAATPEALEFFENRIRPVLAQDCYECHATATKKKGGLLLDSRPGWQAGGDSGPAIMPGDPDSSLLIQSIRHTHGELAMPKNGAPLDPSVVQDFVRWVRDGAADPRDHPPSAAEVEADTAWPAIRDRRAQWWAFQPLRKETDSQSVLPLSDRIDAEIDRALNAAGLQSNKAADAATLQRRLNLLLTGLPPSSEDALAFEKAYADHPAHAISMEVDRLLADPGFGETWARHWMDWVRYAETHGSEGDPAIPHAWRYRDYLIRALNADIPYPQLLQEHLAGDLLTQPRLRKGINESALGTAHYRMVLHGFTPTDPLDELTTFTDNQIDVVSKAFLGVTVSCARCHNHKFDPISQEDFYALYGIFASCKPALIDVSDAPQRATIQTELTKLRQRIADQLATAWETALQQLPARLQTLPPDKKTASADTALALWNSASANSAADLSQLWNQLQQQAQQQRDAQKAAAKNAPFWSWDARTDLLQPFWHASATGSGGHVTPAGAFHVPESGDHLLDSLLPAGIHSHLGSETDRGVLISHRFPAEKGHRVWIRIAGGEKARARFVIQNYPRRGTVYPKTDLTNSNPQWIEWDLDYFDGDTAHLEITTEADQPVETANAPRSWFSVAAVQCLPEGQRPTEPLTTLAALLPPDPASPQNLTDLAGRYQIAARSALQAWRSGQATDAQITFLNTLLTAGLLPTTTSEIPEAAPLLQRYQRLVETLPPPVRAPGVLEADAFDQALFVQGDHKNPSASVPRRFLESLDATPYHPKDSGRLQLAQSMVREDNPLTWRVIVNRVWLHLFGSGLVSTPDNLGRLGQSPSNPELLDLLASRFRDSGGSLKELIRAMILTRTFQRASGIVNHPSATQLARVDPDNRLLSHYPIRRLDAEAIRDGILAATNVLDTTREGESVPGSTPRRSVYVRVIRNNLDPLLSAFDAPVPSSTRGLRDATNVPSQSLALMNDPLIIDWCRLWASKLPPASASQPPQASSLTPLLQSLFNRPPQPEELTPLSTFWQQSRQQHATHSDQLQTLENKERTQRQRIQDLLQPARAQWLEDRKKPLPLDNYPQPWAEWDFEKDGKDRIHGLALTLNGSARIADGQLVLDGSGWAESPPLPISVHAKTFEAWVRLEDLDQRGGGVVSLQDLQGQVFDSLVFAEKTPRRWVAGSDRFTRSAPFNGTDETDAATAGLVHVAITYAADGTVTGYRDGQPYGKPFRVAPLADYPAHEGQLLLGCRHGRGGGNRLLTGRIARARFYDRALSAEEIARTRSLEDTTLREADLIAALSPAQRTELENLRRELASIESQLQTTRSQASPLPPETQAWADLAQALLNTKEFLYLR